MHPDKHIPILLVLAALLIGGVSICSAADSKDSKSDANTAPATKPSPESSLKKGMAAKEVQQLLGKPVEIKAVKAPTGKAEVWIYRRETNRQPKQIQTGTNVIKVPYTGTDGVEQQRIVAEVPIFTTQFEITEEVLSVLMFNGYYLEKKVTNTVRRDFH
ncbi:MAG: hypothetical protein WC378_02515 [Opitutaceae bacterium]|jgi:outer membrane protein assembly factor BamE (lipoprotein component of BamABCDE complex)